MLYDSLSAGRAELIYGNRAKYSSSPILNHKKYPLPKKLPLQRNCFHWKFINQK